VAVGKIYNAYFDGVNVSQITRWFEMGGAVRLDESLDSAGMVAALNGIQGLLERTNKLGLSENEIDAVRVAAGEFILEGLYSHRRISRSEEQGFVAGERERKRERETPDPDDIRRPSSRKQFN